MRERCGSMWSMFERVNRNILLWFGHMERIEVERLTKRIYIEKVEGTRGRCRSKRRWTEGVQELTEQRGHGFSGSGDEHGI